jgi:hypothetical protein
MDDSKVQSVEALKGKSISNIFNLDLFDDKLKIDKMDIEIPITLTYNDLLVKNNEKISVFYFNDNTNEWEYVGGKILNNSKIIFKTTHFSKYAVREYNKTFDDIQNHWAKNDIEILASRKITNGVSEEKFITNAEFITLLARVLNLKESSESIEYEDVIGDEWYIDNLRNAKNSELLDGSYEEKFYPNDPIKRENMANILVNAYFYYTNTNASDIYISQEVRFLDEGSISNAMRYQVRISNALGLINGDDLGYFYPSDGATRAEATAVIKRLLKLLELM